MSFDTPFVEYLIIGTHTSMWMLLAIMKIFNLSLSQLEQLDSGVALLFLPIIYLLGILFDTIVFRFLNKKRLGIKKEVIIDTTAYKKYSDEVMAHFPQTCFLLMRHEFVE